MSLDCLPVLLAATEGAASEGFAGTFGINGTIIVAQILNFAIVAFLVWRFAFKPVVNTMDERRERIAQGLKDAEDARQDRAQAEEQRKAIVAEARAQAQDILAQARAQAEAYEQRAREETALQVQQMREQGQASTQRERAQMLSELRGELARLVVLTAESVLPDQLGDDQRQRINQAAAESIAGRN